MHSLKGIKRSISQPCDAKRQHRPRSGHGSRRRKIQHSTGASILRRFWLGWHRHRRTNLHALCQHDHRNNDRRRRHGSALSCTTHTSGIAGRAAGAVEFFVRHPEVRNENLELEMVQVNLNVRTDVGGKSEQPSAVRHHLTAFPLFEHAGSSLRQSGNQLDFTSTLAWSSTPIRS